MALRDLFIRLGIKIDGAEGLNKAAIAADRVKAAAIRAEAGLLRAKTALDKANAAARKGSGSGKSEGFLGQLASAATIYGIMRIGRGIAAFVNQQIDAAVRLDVMAEKLGVSTRELKMYQFIADKSKISFVELTTAFRFFNRAAGEVGLGTKGTTKIFNQMGLQVRDAHGQMKPTEELLFEFSDKLAKIPDQATRTAYAMRALGRGGSALLPILQQGSAELRNQFHLYETFTGGPSERMIRVSKEFNDRLALQKLGWKALASAVMEAALPMMKKWQDRALENTKVMLDYIQNTTVVKTGLMALGGAAVIGALVALGRAIQATFAVENFGVAALILATLTPLVGMLYWSFDDLYGLLTGVDSVTGNWLTTLYGVEGKDEIVKNLKDAFQALGTEIFGAGFDMDNLKQSVADFAADEMPTFIRITIKGLLGIAEGVDIVVTLLREAFDLIRAIVGLVATVSMSPGLLLEAITGKENWAGEASKWGARQVGAGVSDMGTAGKDWFRRGERMGDVWNAVDKAFPDMPRGHTKQMRDERLAQEKWARDNAVDMDAPIPGPRRAVGMTRTTAAGPIHTETHVTINAKGFDEHALHALVQETVKREITTQHQATFNQMNPGRPDPAFSFGS